MTSRQQHQPEAHESGEDGGDHSRSPAPGAGGVLRSAGPTPTDVVSARTGMETTSELIDSRRGEPYAERNRVGSLAQLGFRGGVVPPGLAGEQPASFVHEFASQLRRGDPIGHDSRLTGPQG